MAAASRVTETPCSKETGKTETCGLDKAYAPRMCSLFRWRFNLVNVESPLPTPTSFLVTRASQQSQGLLQQQKHRPRWPCHQTRLRGRHRQPRGCTRPGRVCRIAVMVPV